MTYSNLAAPTIAGIQIGTAAPSPDVQIAENGAPGRVIGELVFAGHNSGHNFTFEFLDWLHPTQTIEVPFEIVPGTGDDDGKFFFKLKANQSLAYETNESLSFTLKITDNDQTDYNTASLNIGVYVHNINEAPTAIDFGTTGNVFSIVGTTAGNHDVIATLRTTDPDAGDSHTYTIVDDNGDLLDDDAFAIDGSDIIVLNASRLGDRVGPQTLRIKSTDEGGLFTYQVVTISVEEPSEITNIAIKIGNSTNTSVDVAENGEAGRVIGELIFSGFVATHNYSFEFKDAMDEDVDVPFEVVRGLGTNADKFFFKLKPGATLDFEGAALPAFAVKITDTTIPSNEMQTITVNVSDVNDAPTAIDFGTAGNVTTTVSRNAPTGTAFQSLRTIDQDTGDTHTYAIVIGNNSSTPVLNSAFAIGTGDDAGKLVVRHAGLLAALSGPQTLWIKSTDSGVGHLSVWTQVTVNVAVPSHENHAPTGVEILINDDNPTTAFALEELGEAGRFIGRLSPIDWDDDDSSTFEIVDQNSPFEVFTNEDGITSLKLKANTVLDREAYANGTFTLHIKVTDGAGASFTQAFTVNVGNVNEAPTDITLSKAAIAENSVAGTEVGILAAIDQDFVDSFTFSLADNAGDAFKIENGKLVVADASKLDYETATSHKIKVKVTDAGGLSFEKELVVGVTDVAENVDGAKKNDKLVGGVGADILDGKLGKDTLTGGLGKDAFVFSTKLGKSNVDKITDFKVGEDMIYLDNAIFKKLGKAGSLASPVKLKKANFVLGDKAKDKDDYVGYDSKKGVLWYDSNGSAAGGQETIATLSKKLKMTVDHFFIV